jgi:ABC-type tungstate transport system permease subunit
MGRKTNASELEDDLRPEYDFSKMKIVGRGIYAKRYRSGTNLVLLEPDVRKAFPDDESVNEALRVIAEAAKSLVSRGRNSSAKKRRSTPRVR